MYVHETCAELKQKQCYAKVAQTWHGIVQAVALRSLISLFAVAHAHRALPAVICNITGAKPVQYPDLSCTYFQE